MRAFPLLPARQPQWLVLLAVGILTLPLGLSAASFHTGLERVHELIAAQRYAEARTTLEQELAPLPRVPTERARLLEAQGTIEAALGRYPEAIATLRRCLELKAHLPVGSQQRVLYVLGQLLLRTGDYAASAEALEAWFKRSSRSTAEAHLLLGSAYLKSGRLEAGVAQLEQAQDKRRPLPEAWARQLLAAYQQAGRSRQAAALLRQLLTKHPDNRADWLRLAALQLKLDAPTEALGILETAERRGWLKNPSEILDLVRLQRALGAPYRAARLLENALAQQHLSADANTQRLLIDTWRQAREIERAYAACIAANRNRSDPALHRIEAELALELGHWQAAVAAAQRVVATVDQAQAQAAEAWLLQGIALASLQRWNEASVALARASDVPAVSSRAATWLRYVQQALTHQSKAGG